jgi:hypothetical protein
MPDIFNVIKLSDTGITHVTQTWLDKCTAVKPLDFDPKYLNRQNIRNNKKNRYLPIGFDKLSSDNKGLHDIISG